MVARILAIVISVLCCLVGEISIAEEENPCKCKFDTEVYSARCDCALTCSQLIENNKHCLIVCDGSPRNVPHGDSSFGRRMDYLYRMQDIMGAVRKTGWDIFKDKGFAEVALPGLLRCGYIGARFLSRDRKEELDILILRIYKQNGLQIHDAFLGRKPEFNKSLGNGIRVRAMEKKIEIDIKPSLLRLIFVQ